MFELPNLKQLIDIVRLAAKNELLPRFHSHARRINSDKKSDHSLITEADLAMQKTLHEKFSSHWPKITFLGEEMPKSQQEAVLADSAEGVWVVDPIDGTSNYSLGIPYYAVSVALVKEDKIQLAVVYDPSRDECFSAQIDQGACLNDIRLELSDVSEVNEILTALVDFKRLAPELAQKIIAAPPYQSQRSFGSVALDWCWIAAARGDVNVHGKQNLWDYCAGALILSEAGGINSTLEGEPVFNGSLNPRSAVLAINEAVYRRWYEFLTC
ncbi:Inositol-1-monophosphatase [hydrothermal vent metagenome]|uniref:Inositol-1-monophosphatase n=1 Tax=hydrothermal vent metagenome TaxID=652676 RepID=A0A3B0ZVF8_9ZZZZ